MVTRHVPPTQESGEAQSVETVQLSLRSPRCGAASAVLAGVTHTLPTHSRLLAQSNVRVHDSPRALVPPPVSKLFVVPQPTIDAPTSAAPATSEAKKVETVFILSLTSLS